MANSWSNVTTVSEMLQMANNSSGGWFWTAMLYMIFVILFVSMLNFGFYVSLLGASFTSLLLGVLLVYMGLVAWTWVAFFVGLIVLMFIWIMFNNDK